MNLELKKLFDRYEIYIMITLGLLMAFLSLLDVANSRTYSSVTDAPSSFQAAMIYGGSAGEIFSFVLLNALVVLPYVDSYYSEQFWRVQSCILTRQNRVQYLWEKATAIIVSAILVVGTPYLLNQLYCFIAYPLEQTRTYLGGSIYDNNIAQEILHTPTQKLYMSHPFLLNLLHIGYACLYGVAIAMAGYALSLFIHKNKAITNLLPIAVPLIFTFVGMNLFGPNYAPALAIIVKPAYSLTSLTPALIIICSIYFLCFAAIVLRSKYIKDEL